MKPKVLILKADGINCDEELAFAFNLAGGDAKTVHVNQLRKGEEKLSSFQILAIPGGFSYGDDIVSGKILSTELTSFFSEELRKFIERKTTLIIGICNGFQVLIRTGLLPFRTLGKMQATLTNNDSGKFECRWINLRIEQNSRCVFLKNFTSDGGSPELAKGMTPPRWKNNNLVSYQVAHGEGKFFTDEKTLQAVEQMNLVAFRYIDLSNLPTQSYPQNPNGALNAIAGICDTTGRILGMMPHPERFVLKEQYPNWRRKNILPLGLPIFQNMISYVKNV